MWKLVSRILPTGDNLRRRHISTNSICKRCYEEKETPTHLFFDCHYAKSIWIASGILNQSILNTWTSLQSKLESTFSFNRNKSLSKLRHLPLWILWRLWKSRNVLIFQRKDQVWRKILRLANDDAGEWMNTREYLESFNTRNNEAGQNQTPATQFWKRPNPQWLKCNYDASFSNRDQEPQAG